MRGDSEISASQYTLGELIDALEAVDGAQAVPLGFGNPHSYRGYYEQLAFEPVANTTVADMLAAAQEAVGTTYEGWKGGDFTMSESTDVWLSLRGEAFSETIGRVMLSLMLGTGPS